MRPEVAISLAGVVVTTVKKSIAPVLERLAAVDARLEAVNRIGERSISLEERLSALEARPPIAGPKGEPGERGEPGQGIEDIAIDFDGNRSLTFLITRGGIATKYPVAVPFLRYQGTYQFGYPYVIGDVITDKGNAWHCEAPTTLRPGTTTAWRLMVRKGRDSREPAKAGAA